VSSYSLSTLLHVSRRFNSSCRSFSRQQRTPLSSRKKCSACSSRTKTWTGTSACWGYCPISGKSVNFVCLCQGAQALVVSFLWRCGVFIVEAVFKNGYALLCIALHHTFSTSTCMQHLPHQLPAIAAALFAAGLPADVGQKVQRCCV